ncbi:MAG: hypothetical protein R3D44_00545 [Hyphomicrobiaceae bacterium]
MTTRSSNLEALWRTRNSAAETLALTESQMRRAIGEASVEELVALIETFSPALATGPEWTRTFEPLVERLWAWASDDTMAALSQAFAARGMPWAAVANAFSKENGSRVRASLRQPAWARLPAFALI